MSTTTPNFGWQVPTSTDYVKDGAVAIETLGDAIDASLADLKGGTTGQVLSKATNTDMDFVWVTPDDADAIQNTIVDAKGDLIAATAADTPARLASSGVNGEVLTVDTSTSTGLKWAAPSNWQLIATATPSAATTVSFTSIPTSYVQLMIVWSDVTQSTNARFDIRLNNDSTTNAYNFMGAGLQGNASLAGFGTRSTAFGSSDRSSPISNATAGSGFGGSAGFFQVWRANAGSGRKYCSWGSYNDQVNADWYGPVMAHGYYDSTAAITRIDFIRNSTQTITGNIYLYGMG